MDRSAGLSFQDEDLVITNSELTDTEPPLLSSSAQTQPPPLPSPGEAGLELRDGPPHGATVSSTRHRMMPFAGQASPLERHQGHRDHQGPGRIPPQTLQPPSLQSAPDWFPFDDSSASGPTGPFLHPVDPFLAHPGPNITNFALGFHGHALEYPEDTHSDATLPPHLPLSGPNSAVNFDFDFPLPQWEPTFAPSIPLPDIQRDEAPVYERPEPGHAMPVEAFAPEMPWFEEDQTSLTTDHRTSHTFTPPARVARKKTKKDKDRADSTASGSVYSASIASTQEAFPFPDPSTNPSNPLNPPSSKTTDRRRGSRNKGRTRSVTTTTSASSSSTAPTPSISGPRSQPPANRPPEQPPSTNSSRLRSASRASKNSVSRPSDTLEDRRTRASHNLVEKQYRCRLNAQFEGLLGALPDPEDDVKTEPGATTPADEQDPADKKVSKAEVLERARVHIETLERQSQALTRQREELLESLIRAERELARAGAAAGRRLPDSVGDGAESPLEQWEEKRDEGVKEEVFREEA